MKKIKEECEREGHEYSMVYNDGTTCMNCGHHRMPGEESGEIRSVSGVEVPALLCDLARVLPMPKCPPEHTLREHPDYCKACDESRDELQQMVGDGDLSAIAIVVGVYLRRLYALHEKISAQVWELGGEHRPVKLLADDLETVFAEVLTDEERGIPTDDEARDILRKALEVETNEDVARIIRAEIERRRQEAK